MEKLYSGNYYLYRGEPMNSTIKRYGFILMAAFAAILSACSVDNKNIPDPGGNQIVDTTGTTGTFYLNVTGDTSFILTMVAVDTIVNDSLGVVAGDFATRDEIIFTTAKADVGTYYTEQSPPGITGAVCIFRKKITSGYRNYPMLHGKIIISSIDYGTGLIKGSLDVDNQYVTSADRLYRLKANFVLKLPA